MRLPFVDAKNGTVEVVSDSIDDLSFLAHFIQRLDLVSGTSNRVYKPEGSSQAERKKVWVKIRVEKMDFQESTHTLKAIGTIVEGKPEVYCPTGASHSIELDLREKFRIEKNHWSLSLQKEIEKVAHESTQSKLLVLLLDDEAADFFELSGSGFLPKARILSGRSGKRFSEEKKDEYFVELKKYLENSGQRVLLAGPGFTVEELGKYLKSTGSKVMFTVEKTSHAGKSGLLELEKRGDTIKALESFSLQEKANLMEEVLQDMGKDTGKVAYGLKEVKAAMDAGAIDYLLVAQVVLFDEKEAAWMPILDQAYKLRLPVHVLSEKTESGQQLKGLGGVVAHLRYKFPVK